MKNKITKVFFTIISLLIATLLILLITLVKIDNNKIIDILINEKIELLIILFIFIFIQIVYTVVMIFIRFKSAKKSIIINVIYVLIILYSLTIFFSSIGFVNDFLTHQL